MNHSVIDPFLQMGFEEPCLSTNKEANASLCDTPGYEHLAANCVGGRWIPSHCVNNPFCKDILVQDPTWTDYVVEQWIINLRLNLTVAYLCTGFTHALDYLKSTNAMSMYHSQSPSVTLIKHPATRVVFPEHDFAQWEGRNHSLNGDLSTDYSYILPDKTINTKVCDTNPDVCAFFTRH